MNPTSRSAWSSQRWPCRPICLRGAETFATVVAAARQSRCVFLISRDSALQPIREIFLE
jgi:hypothetical protein